MIRIILFLKALGWYDYLLCLWFSSRNSLPASIDISYVWSDHTSKINITTKASHNNNLSLRFTSCLIPQTSNSFIRSEFGCPNKQKIMPPLFRNLELWKTSCISRHLQYQRLHHSHALGILNSDSCSHTGCSHALIHNETGKLLIIVTQISGDNAREFSIANTWLGIYISKNNNNIRCSWWARKLLIKNMG